MSNNVESKLKELDFEDILWIIFAILSFINIYGNYEEKEYLKTNNILYKQRANEIFIFTIIVTGLIYIYIFYRNYNDYKKAPFEQKKLYIIKLVGSSFFIAGILCILYFQINQTSFIGSPSI